MTKIEQLESRIKSLTEQVEKMKAKLGPGPSIDALVYSTQMLIEEIEEQIHSLRAGTQT